MRKLFSIAISFLFSMTMLAQTTVKGNVKDAKTGEPLPGVNIKVVGKSLGTTTDFDGNYTLRVNQEPPFDIMVTTLGYAKQTMPITKANQSLDISLEENSSNLDEVVVSASRTPESVRESPVTIERMDVRGIKNTPAANFYDGLESLKGVDINTNSLTFKSINTKGFATFSNTRFVQLVDGMDNSSPALNFVLGNLLGMSELDVNSVEILPGASSALYGANAFNGILFMTSKNPFDHQGISVYAKTGITTQEAAGNNQFYDVGLRVAHAFTDKFAAKASFSYLDGTDWWATDYRHYDREARTFGTQTRADADFDGLNVYGDEVATTLNWDTIAGTPAGTLGTQKVSRTGFNEVDLMDYNARSIKTDFSFNFRPNGDDFEIVWNSKFGVGNTIYQGANRYSLKNFFMQQHKLEFSNKDFFVRGYITSESAGDSYDSRFTAINLNRSWKGDQAWFGDYARGYLGLFTGQALADPATAALVNSLGFTPGNVANANAFGRILADNRLPNGAILNETSPSIPKPGTDTYKAALNEIISDPSLLTGSKFTDNSKTYHAEGNYNFKRLLKDAIDLQIGGSYRVYSLNSDGTIFTDYDGAINYNEYGAYMQGSKKFAEDRLKITASIRYDKAQNFDGSFSPRVAMVYSAGANKNHNIRASFQTGFRNPTTQDQYIGLDVGNAFLVGSASDNLDRYTTRPLNVSTTGQFLENTFGGGLGATTELSGRRAYDNAFTLTSLRAFGASAAAGTPDPSLLKVSNVDYVQPEKVTALELGYRGKVGSVTVDLNGYYNKYDKFIDVKTVVVPFYGQVDFSDTFPISNPATPKALAAIANGDYTPFQVYTNSTVDISSYGLGLGLSTRVAEKFKVGVNYTWANFDYDETVDPDFVPGFNTPEHTVKVSFGSPNAYKNFGFNINTRYATEYTWQNTFADGLIPSRFTADAQISYTVPKWKSQFKLGGANLGGKEYQSALGTGFVGSQYFISWTVNN